MYVLIKWIYENWISPQSAQFWWSQEGMIRTICKSSRISNLKLLSEDMVLIKLKSVVPICSLKTINCLFKKGLFHNKQNLDVVVAAIKSRNLESQAEASERLISAVKNILFLIGSRITYQNIDLKFCNNDKTKTI